jgi:tetratricopeptide (TPR) repeat protein
MQLDSGLAEAHVALGDIEFLWNWNWQRGEAEYRRALELNPGSVDAQLHYGLCMMLLGRSEAGLQHMERARELDPLSPVINLAYGAWLRAAGQPQRALWQLQRSIEVSPTYASNYACMGDVYEDMGQSQLALEARIKAAILNGQSSDTIQQWRNAFQSGGLPAVKKQTAKARLRRLTASSQRTRVSPMEFASAFAALGENTRALEWLEKAYEARSPRLPWLRLQRDWDPLRSDPGFQALLARMKL